MLHTYIRTWVNSYCYFAFASKHVEESHQFGSPHKWPTALHPAPEKIKLAKLVSEHVDCVAADPSPSSDNSHNQSSRVLTNGTEFTSKHITADLLSKCPLSHAISGSCDHNGRILTSKDGDLKLTIPEGAIKEGDLVTLSLASDLYGPFVLPSKRQADVVIPYYWIGVSGSYHFQKPVQVEFQHFAVVTACDPSHYQLLCCEDDDESYTMQPAVSCNPKFTVQDDISWCAFYTDHFCLYCLLHGCKDPGISRITALYLKTENYQYLTHFTAEIWFSLNINHCLRRNEELYTKQGLILDHTCSCNFKAACDKDNTSYFTLIYPEEVNGWDVEHSRSKIIETKDINFYNNYTDKEHLKRNEENSLFPECFIVNVTKESGCNTDLNREIIVTLRKNEGKIQESIPFQHFVQISGMITNRLSLTDTVPQTRATNIAGTYILIRKCVLRLPI